MKNLNKKKNTSRLRAEVYKLITNTVSSNRESKTLLINLWNLAIEKNILKLLLNYKKFSYVSSPDTTLNWFILAASKALVLAEDEVDAAKTGFLWD